MNAPRHLGHRVRVLSQAIRQAIDRKLTDLDLTGQQSFILRYLSERKDACKPRSFRQRPPAKARVDRLRRGAAEGDSDNKKADEHRKIELKCIARQTREPAFGQKFR